MQTDGQIQIKTDRNDENIRRFSQFCEDVKRRLIGDHCFSVHVVKVHNLRYQLHAPVLLIRKVQDYIDPLHSRH
jgi:hypothetical protein